MDVALQVMSESVLREARRRFCNRLSIPRFRGLFDKARYGAEGET